jgi:hypothetical protein
MILKFSPQYRSDGPLTLTKQGDTLIINGISVDFSPLHVGYKLPRAECQNGHPFLLEAQRNEGGILEVTILLPYGPGASSAVEFPQPVTVIEDGDIEVPV